MIEYKYPDYLPTLQILASDTVKEYENAKKNLGATIDLTELSNNMITNSTIQKIETVEGNHMLHLTNVNDLVGLTKRFPFVEFGVLISKGNTNPMWSHNNILKYNINKKEVRVKWTI